ncbi:long-chain fatty acid transport protein 4 isoform X2 [Anthonomus grandis grandis]|uniref:long-chain fatty acid transport protein 4 isoform X2 n=1 Tax=Anthonomus grandis grandis TaxID=2921223 RepID=UPI002165FBB3|nr:long-chain fatty acid transport protein 4 isoform X2 [Anthonomus grandis grandis]
MDVIIIPSGNDNKKLDQTSTEDAEIGTRVNGAKGKSTADVIVRRKNRQTRPVRVLVRRFAVMAIGFALLGGLAAVFWYFFGPQFLVQLAIVVLVAYLAAGHWRWFYVALVTAPRDLGALIKYIKCQIQVKYLQGQDLPLYQIFQQNVRKHPHKPAILFEDQEWTFMQIDEYSNKIANIFKSHGYKKGDIVALYLENKPEFVCIWLGLSKLGVIVSLINTNLRLTSLVHSITIVKSQAVIFGAELSHALTEVLDKLESKVALYQINCNNNASPKDERFENLDLLLKDAPVTKPQINEKIGHHDHLVYIYTSGTTGLPKAAVISTSRYFFIAAAMKWLCAFRPSDRFYCPLPLYHTAGGCMSMGQMLIYGSSIVIRKKFSASSYFPECRKYNCTTAQYIGEMCRYILAVPPKESDTDHKIRMIFGNGLRPQIWQEFVDRFKIKNVAEFYGATEGNANIVNTDNTVGAIGFVSRIIPQVYPISIIKVDEHGEPVRDARGLCQACAPNEPGVFIGKIIPNNPSRAFLGYVDEEASKKKIVRNVFRIGDSAFISGDILIADQFGYLFFKDRTGDTFRWKGENVSTSEVEAVISNIVNYKDVVVYGVEVRGMEGRAGMAALYDPERTVDLNKEFYQGLVRELPSYARPIFVRILTKLDLTGTYKLKKNDLQKEGFNPSSTTDSIYYLTSKGQYELVTPEIYEKINSGEIRI